MFLLDINIAKLNHVASLVNSSSRELIFSNFKFQNNILGLESTGHYGENFINFFFQNRFKIAVINLL